MEIVFVADLENNLDIFVYRHLVDKEAFRERSVKFRSFTGKTLDKMTSRHNTEGKNTPNKVG